MSGVADLKMPALDFALARLGPLRGTPVTVTRPLDPAKAVFAARLRRCGAVVQEAPANGPCYVLDATFEDLTGHLGATTRAPQIAQNTPVVDLSQSPLMRLAHDHIGIGQASIMALLDITNLQLAGRSVVVCGFGPSGGGVAAHAAALGGRVTVVEADALRATQAMMVGYSVRGFAQALPPAEVVFVTDDGPKLTQGHCQYLSPGVILCAAGANAAISPEIVAFGGDLRPVRAHVEAFDLPHASGLKLVARGLPLHLAEGQGLPFEARDIVLALHILALDQLLRVGPAAPQISPLNPAAEADLAAIMVAQMGGDLELETGSNLA